MRQRISEREITAAMERYWRLLDACAREEDVQSFLEEHIYFWTELMRHDTPCPLYSKIRLGSEYVVDFAYFDPSSNGPEWFLVEIERPCVGPIFVRNGDPSGKLMHAIAQVENWQEWIAKNLPYAQKLMPQVDRPFGLVFYGRRSELESEHARARLRALNRRYRGHLQVRTLDSFIDGAEVARRTGSGPYEIPQRALTHNDLCNGLPEDARAFLQHPMGEYRKFIEERLTPPWYPEPEEDVLDWWSGNKSVVIQANEEEAKEARQHRLRLADEAGRMELLFDESVVYSDQRKPGLTWGGNYSTFRLRLYEGYQKRPVAIASQLPFEGVSLANNAQRLCQEVWKIFFPREERPPIWIEHYPGSQLGEWSIAEFIVEGDYRLGSPPRRSLSSHKEVEELVGQEVLPRREDYWESNAEQDDLELLDPLDE
jgi:hypothetical protein